MFPPQKRCGGCGWWGVFEVFFRGFLRCCGGREEGVFVVVLGGVHHHLEVGLKPVFDDGFEEYFWGVLCGCGALPTHPTQRLTSSSFLLGAPLVDDSPTDRATQARSTLSYPGCAAHTPHNRWVCDARKLTPRAPPRHSVPWPPTPHTHPRKSRCPRPVVGVCGRVFLSWASVVDHPT